MLWVPTVSAALAQLAVRIFPLPGRATAEQPPIEVEPSLKFTVPVGLLPVTVAVKVTLVPTMDGVREVARLVLVPPLLTTCDRVALLEAALPASPP